jgi:hypothetical protein
MIHIFKIIHKIKLGKALLYSGQIPDGTSVCDEEAEGSKNEPCYHRHRHRGRE